MPIDYYYQVWLITDKIVSVFLVIGNGDLVIVNYQVSITYYQIQTL
ncbi:MULTISPECIES: hypothetical protein [unclassified Moorena]|nr:MULTISPECIES: hypothetical protein [unclassified Moorena]NEQ10411.1 hypothetical protein [Moorena sp. SIO4E2]NEQ14966.1 hypothetical protein [Moorena sp. SIO3E2]NES41816.1 hypothetical protein [Moorena sp. SIO2C4]NET66336.1 hypothetical protein [Moorena sp. SIO1G6]